MKRQNRVAFFNILSTLLLRGISIFTMPLFTRLLDNSGYGIIQVYNTWTAVLAIVFTMQTQGTLVNARMEYPEQEQRRYQSAAMGLSVTVFLICSAVVLCFLSPISGLLKLSRWLVVLMLIQSFGTFCINFLNSKFVYEFKAGRNMLMSLGVTLMSLGLSLLLIFRLPEESRYIGRVVGIAATYSLIGIPACIWILWQGKTLFRREYWKFCIYLAIPMVFYNLSDLVLGQSDKVMVQQMLGTDAAGIYSAALNFGGIMFTIFAALNNSWCPFFFEDMRLGNREAVEKKARNFLELFTVLAVGFLLLSREVYRIFVGADFRSGTNLIPVFVTSYFLNFLCTFPINYEYYRKQTKMVAAVTIVSSLLNLGLNYVLLQRFGAAGAALATMISHCLQLTAHEVYTRLILKQSDHPFRFGLIIPYTAAYLGIVAVFYLTPGLWLLRWGLGAAIGLWELLRIRRRKVLI